MDPPPIGARVRPPTVRYLALACAREVEATIGTFRSHAPRKRSERVFARPDVVVMAHVDIHRNAGSHVALYAAVERFRGWAAS